MHPSVPWIFNQLPSKDSLSRQRPPSRKNSEPQGTLLPTVTPGTFPKGHEAIMKLSCSFQTAVGAKSLKYWAIPASQTTR